MRHATGSHLRLSLVLCLTGLSILAGKEAWDTDYDPVFELIDHERDRTYEVQEIPTPQQAKKMLQEHGLPLGEGET